MPSSGRPRGELRTGREGREALEDARRSQRRKTKTFIICKVWRVRRRVEAREAGREELGDAKGSHREREGRIGNSFGWRE